MKARRFPLLVLLVGILFAAFGLVLPIIVIRTGGAATGIIGGAGSPTYWYVANTVLRGFPLLLDLFGAAMILTSLPAVFFIKTFQRICSLKTSAITIALSAIGGLGLTCALYCYTIAAFHERSRHPVGYPLSLSMGLISLCAFILLICVYFKARGAKRSVISLIYDVICSILYLPAFFFTSSYIASLF